MADGVRKIDEPILVDPSFVGLGFSYGKDEVRGWPPGLERSHEVGHKLLLLTQDELDLLAGVLLEGGDDLSDRLVLFGGLSLLPPYDEVSGVCAERRDKDQHGGKKRISTAHYDRLPDQTTASMSLLLVPSNVGANRELASAIECVRPRIEVGLGSGTAFRAA